MTGSHKQVKQVSKRNVTAVPRKLWRDAAWTCAGGRPTSQQACSSSSWNAARNALWTKSWWSDSGKRESPPRSLPALASTVACRASVAKVALERIFRMPKTSTQARSTTLARSATLKPSMPQPLKQAPFFEAVLIVPTHEKFPSLLRRKRPAQSSIAPSESKAWSWAQNRCGMDLRLSSAEISAELREG